MNTTRTKMKAKDGGGWTIRGYVNGIMEDCSWTAGNAIDARQAEFEMLMRWKRRNRPTAAQTQAVYEEAMGRS